MGPREVNRSKGGALEVVVVEEREVEIFQETRSASHQLDLIRDLTVQTGHTLRFSACHPVVGCSRKFRGVSVTPMTGSMNIFRPPDPLLPFQKIKYCENVRKLTILSLPPEGMSVRTCPEGSG